MNQLQPSLGAWTAGGWRTAAELPAGYQAPPARTLREVLAAMTPCQRREASAAARAARRAWIYFPVSAR